MGLVVEFNLKPAHLPSWPWEIPGSRGLEGLRWSQASVRLSGTDPERACLLLPAQSAPAPAEPEIGLCSCKTWIKGLFGTCSEWVSTSLLRIC